MSLVALLALAVTLPTGARLDPTGTSFDVGNMPLSLAMAPGGDRAVLLMSGWREEGLEVVDWRAGRVVQHVPQAGAFLGLAFSKDGRTLFASGGGEDVVYRYGWSGDEAHLQGKLVLGTKAAGEPPRAIPQGWRSRPTASSSTWPRTWPTRSRSSRRPAAASSSVFPPATIPTPWRYRPTAACSSPSGAAGMSRSSRPAPTAG